MKLIVLLAALSLLSAVTVAQPAWQPAEAPLRTRWASEVRPETAWRSYPRPTLRREHWVNLNGLWSYAILEPDDSRDATGVSRWDGRILVPYPIESALSGVARRLSPEQRLVYARKFSAPDRDTGERIILHFEAVDWHARVFVNGRAVGEHRGGYDRASFDITDTLTDADEQSLLVEVSDPTDAGTQPRGKQVLEPNGIWYTPTSGIWQTVWLERVPANAVARVLFDTNIRTGEAVARIETTRDEVLPVRLLVTRAGERLAEAVGTTAQPIRFAVPDHANWSPDSPVLYDAQLVVGEDSVSTAFAFREITVQPDEQGVQRFHLNGEPIFLWGTLDQGFWPDGLYTPPTESAMVYDLVMTRRLGFNTIRKHVKVEPEIWYAACDRLGILVIQDMPNGDRHIGPGQGEIERSLPSAAQYMTELNELLDEKSAHPSIIMWCPFNEGWGQFNTVAVSRHIKQLDPSRLVDPASGWNDFPVGDVLDIHLYPGPGTPSSDGRRAAFLGEFGGLGLPIPGHIWQSRDNWGYRTYQTQAELIEKYLEHIEAVRWEIASGLAGAIYTQTTDVEGEVNGLMTYDRAILKLDDPRILAAHRKLLGPPPTLNRLVPTSRDEPANWRYTFTEPKGEWTSPQYDDSTWEEGPAGFGRAGTPGAAVRTPWHGSDIWIRRTVTLGEASNPMLLIHHDEDAEVYFDGVPAASLKGYTVTYEIVPIEPAAAHRLADGKVTIAIHCRQTGGGQYLDAGIVELIESCDD
ncbi:MAG: glycoside hydrolase family 2 protein [Phycisphaerales bacterium JB037]